MAVFLKNFLIRNKSGSLSVASVVGVFSCTELTASQAVSKMDEGR